jgi:hypothetical protein
MLAAVLKDSLFVLRTEKHELFFELLRGFLEA